MTNKFVMQQNGLVVQDLLCMSKGLCVQMAMLQPFHCKYSLLVWRPGKYVSFRSMSKWQSISSSWKLPLARFQKLLKLIVCTLDHGREVQWRWERGYVGETWHKY